MQMKQDWIRLLELGTKQPEKERLLALEGIVKSIVALPDSDQKRLVLRIAQDRLHYYRHRSARLQQKKEYGRRRSVRQRRAAYLRSETVKARRRLQQNKAYQLDPDKKKKQVYAYRARNPGAAAKAVKKWQERNRDKARLSVKKWRESNRLKAAEMHRKYKLGRRKSDPGFRLLGNLRRRLNLALRNASATKDATTLAMVGCSVSFLMQWLESKFQPGMTWSNYGPKGWHVDHKIPCSKFDLTQPEQRKVCFHYTNLQPLWSTDNQRKRDKLS
jgi:hypothetical protein